MCGRFAQATSISKIHDLLDIVEKMELKPRYNVAPTTPVGAVRQDEQGRNHWGLFRWGLIPHWAKEINPKFTMINAKAETLSEKPAYRGPFRYRRCIIPVDGYYEWKTIAGQKQPFYFYRKDQPLMLAGLWDLWEKENHHMESLTIITTAASDKVAHIHDRMPVILDKEKANRWMAKNDHPNSLLILLHGTDDIDFHPVNKRMSNPRVDEPSCILAENTA